MQVELSRKRDWISKPAEGKPGLTFGKHGGESLASVPYFPPLALFWPIKFR